MHKVEISLKQNLFNENRKMAEKINALLVEKNVQSIDFMGSIGSGKTLIIEQLIMKLIGIKRVGVIVGDVVGNDDYKRIKKHNVPVANINTGKECHLDAHLVGHAVEDLNLNEIDMLFIENIGNLVCPADFLLGTDMRGVIISVTEGDDMVRKHPLIFQISDFIVVNKLDLVDYVDVDINRILQDIERISPKKVFLTDAKHDKGIEELLEWITWKKG
jgi:hydrogenase nickel incorporation protein HypB